MIVTAGELLTEFVAHDVGPGLAVTGAYSGPFPSGAPAIFIDQAALMGAKARIHGCVGGDAFGRNILGRLARDGVDVSAVAVEPALTTGTAFVAYFEGGAREFIYHIRGTAAEHSGPHPLPSGAITFHVSGSSVGVGGFAKALVDLARQARQQGGEVSCDPNIRVELMKNDACRAALEEIIAISTILLPSEADVAFLFPGLLPADGCRRLLANGARLVVLKQGSRGIRIFTATEEFSLPGHAVDEVDPTGAGDCFCGAFLGLLDQGHSLRDAATLANAAGALHVTERGPMERNPTLDEIRAFLARGGQS